MTLTSENPLPRYASGKKRVTDGRRSDGRTPKQYPPPPQSLGGDNNLMCTGKASICEGIINEQGKLTHV